MRGRKSPGREVTNAISGLAFTGSVSRARNAGVSAPAKDEKRVVFMGDSITDGWKLATYFPSKPYINRGISGQTTPQMLIRFRPDVIALKPQVVVILAGTNDLAGNTGPMSLEAIEANLTSMFELARANNIRVVIASVLPVSDYAKNRRASRSFKPLDGRPRRSRLSMSGQRSMLLRTG
jgi:lysophospholipase L1-like esterase